MIAAFGWGALGASALAFGALIAYRLAPGRRMIANIMAIELIDEALKTRTVAWVALLVLAGAATFAIGDWLLDRRGASERKDPSGRQAAGSPLAIVLGSVLDGIPESFVLGLTVLQGAVSASLFAGIVLSNLPEGMSSSSGLRVAGWPLARVMRMWLAVIAASAIAAAAGYLLLDPQTRRTGALVQAFAAGALLAMVADTLLPEAYEVVGVWTGLLVVVGFAGALALDAL